MEGGGRWTSIKDLTVFSNSEMNVTSRKSRKSRWKIWVIFVVFMFRSWVMILQLPKKCMFSILCWPQQKNLTNGGSDLYRPYNFLKTVIRTFRSIYVNCFSRFRFLAEGSKKMQKMHLFGQFKDHNSGRKHGN